MSELGSGSGTSYPSSVDTSQTEINSPNAGKTKARAECINDLYAAVLAIEGELGSDPAGTLTNVKTFLQTEHNTNGTHNTMTVSGDITLAAAASRQINSAADTGRLIYCGGSQFANGAYVVCEGSDYGGVGSGGGMELVTKNNSDIGITPDGTGKVVVSTSLQAATSVITDTIAEKTAATGVTIDGCTLKDGGAEAMTDVGGGSNLKVKVVNIGDWNMDSTANVSVAHGLTLTKIRSVSAMIRNDADTLYSPIYSYNGTALSGGATAMDSTNVSLARTASGAFDGVDYDSTSFNRGWITIWYTE